jgi:hypothetical protein
MVILLCACAGDSNNIPAVEASTDITLKRGMWRRLGCVEDGQCVI